MIPAAKNRFIEEWFRWYVRRYLRRSFHRVLLAGELPEAPDGPLLICSNHTSWWDMLMAFWLMRDVLGWDCYGPMDERQLRRYGILTRIGVFGVDRESLQGGREGLEYGRSLLAGSRRVLWITAQGAMLPTETRPVRLYSGISRMAQALGSCWVSTACLEYEFWDERKPEAMISLGQPVRVEVGEGWCRTAFHRELEARLERDMDALADLRRTRDASRFRVLLQSGGAFSPMYSFLQRVTAGCGSKRAPLEHGALATPPRWGPGVRSGGKRA